MDAKGHRRQAAGPLSDGTRLGFGLYLTKDERSWLVALINDVLERQAAARAVKEKAPRTDDAAYGASLCHRATMPQYGSVQSS